MKHSIISLLSAFALSIACVTHAVAAAVDAGLKNPNTVQETDNPFTQSRGERSAANVKKSDIQSLYAR